MTVRAWKRACVVAAAVLAAAEPPQEFVFAPAPASELERRWSETLELTVDSLAQTIGGTSVDLPFDSVEFDGRRSFELSDVLAEIADGRPTRLARSFASSALALEVVADGEPYASAEGRHACGQAVVRFAWDAEAQRYDAEFVERSGGELDEEGLERLEPDLDLLGLFPPGAHEPGDAFEPDLAALRALFRAGGDLGYRLTKIQLTTRDLPAEVMVAAALVSLHELFAPEGELAGKVAGRYAGREGEEGEEGVLLARLEYELALEASADLGERFRSFLTEPAPDRQSFLLSAELEGELVLLWDVAARRPRSARFEGDVILKGHLVFPIRVTSEAEPQEFVGDYELSGEATVELVSD